MAGDQIKEKVMGKKPKYKSCSHALTVVSFAAPYCSSRVQS